MIVENVFKNFSVIHKDIIGAESLFINNTHRVLIYQRFTLTNIIVGGKRNGCFCIL